MRDISAEDSDYTQGACIYHDGSTTLDTYTKYVEATMVFENLWLVFGLAPLIPWVLRRKRRAYLIV